MIGFLAKMYPAICLSLIATILPLTLSFAQKNTGFVLRGKIEGLENGTPLYLLLGTDSVGKAVAQDGKFEFFGKVEGEANFYFIVRPKNDTVKGRSVYSNALWLENKALIVEGSNSDFRNLRLQGSVSQAEYLLAMSIFNSNKENEERKMVGLKDFISSHLNSLYTPYLINRLSGVLKVEETRQMYESLGITAKNSFYGQRLSKELGMRDQASKNFKQGIVGSIIPEFKVETEVGEEVSIREVASRNDFTFIDFWASWCGPCKGAVPDIKKMKEEFKGINFEVLGISIDKSENDWKKAIRTQGLDWLHGIDKADSYNNIFLMKAIPGYLLINKEGKILAADYFSADSKGAIDHKGSNLRDSLYSKISVIVMPQKR